MPKSSMMKSHTVAVPQNSSTLWLCLSVCFCLLSHHSGVDAITPSAGLDITLTTTGKSYTLLASQASFGPLSPMTPQQNTPYPLEHAPPSDPFLCQNVSTADSTLFQDRLLLVPRGHCTFEFKTLHAQQMGAAGVIFYSTLATHYSINETTDEPIYPRDRDDYDCRYGRAEIPRSAITLPYDGGHNDPLLSGDDPSQNLCLHHSPDRLQQCQSQACLLTNGNTTSDGTLEACCAWDFHYWLSEDSSLSLNATSISIPAVLITVREASQLKRDMQSGQPVVATVYSRYRSDYNWSLLLIWALGVFVSAVAAYASAGDYRHMTQRVIARRNGTGLEQLVEHSEGGRVAVSTSRRSTAAAAASEESLELSTEHAIAFIVMASSGLFILFFFEIYSVVKVLYGIGCSRAVGQVIFEPIFKKLFRCLRIRNNVWFEIEWEDIGNVTTIDIIAGICGYSLGLTWLWTAFMVRHPENMTFFWVTQDIMGTCMCILFLSLIKLNSMKVASILLTVFFFYDIFFVFITPLLFSGKSIMITVATSGGPPKADQSFCDRYPDDADCQGGDPLPMLLTVPRINDYLGGASLLGLGDIVIPGLLLSFAARLDAAKQFLGVLGGGDAARFCREGGYFPPMVVAYGIGLFMANAAVYWMNTGQPALLYLVPTCLGCMCFLGWTRNELAGLWEGPKVVRTVDAIMFGEYQPELDQAPSGQQQQQQHEALPTVEEGLFSSPPSAMDDPNNSNNNNQA